MFRTDFISDGLVGSPCSPRDSQVFNFLMLESSPTSQFKKINSLALSFLYDPTLTSIRDYWKKHQPVSSVAQLHLTLCDPMDRSTPGPPSITSSQSLLKLMSIESMIPSNHLILCHPFSSCLQSFPKTGSFQMSQLFVSGDHNIGVSASASVLPMNIQD